MAGGAAKEGSLTLFVVERGVALANLAAFGSFWPQLPGLIGSRGIAPARDIMALKDLLGAVADGLDQPLQESIRTLKKEWASIVGEPIAMQSEPAFIREGILYIFVKQAGWLSELSRMRGPLLRKIEGTYSEMNIRKLHFELKRYS